MSVDGSIEASVVMAVFIVLALKFEVADVLGELLAELVVDDSMTMVAVKVA